MIEGIYIALLAMLGLVVWMAMDISQISKYLKEIKQLMEEGADNE